MFDSIHVEPRDVAQIISATFPGYRGRKVEVRASETVALHGLNWSGGSRSQYRACTLDGQQLGTADRFNHVAPWENAAEGARVPVPAGMVVVEHCTFMGKDLGLRITCNPADMPRYLTAPAAELTVHEKLVLHATRSYKASYGGRDRYQMMRESYDASRILGGADYPSRTQWEAAKASLIARGYLNKAGALTNAGRNAA